MFYVITKIEERHFPKIELRKYPWYILKLCLLKDVVNRSNILDNVAPFNEINNTGAPLLGLAESTYYFLSTVSAKGFEYDGLYVHFFLDLPTSKCSSV